VNSPVPIGNFIEAGDLMAEAEIIEDIFDLGQVGRGCRRACQSSRDG
jgi:hypothetical protein